MDLVSMVALQTDAVAFYSDVADEFHDSYKADANRLERVRIWNGFFDRHLRDAAFGYDMGCGSGILACILARRGLEVVGIDGAPNMLAIGERSAREQNLARLSFQQHRLPIDDPRSFRNADVIISSSALEYLDSMTDALRSLHAMMNPGATLIFSVSNHDSLSRKAVRLVHATIGKPAYFGFLKQFMTVDSIRSALSETGFALVEHMYFAKADRINRVLGTVLPDRFASNMIIAAARRV